MVSQTPMQKFKPLVKKPQVITQLAIVCHNTVVLAFDLRLIKRRKAWARSDISFSQFTPPPHPLLAPCLAPRRHRLQERPRVAPSYLHHLLRRAGGDDLAVAVAAPGSSPDQASGPRSMSQSE